MDFVKIPTTSKPTFQFVPEAQLRGQQLRDFVFAGNALFTVLNKESGNYVTFKVKKHKEDDIWFVTTQPRFDGEPAPVAPAPTAAPALECAIKSRFMAGENISPGDAHRRLRRVYILVSNSTEALEFQRISPAESLIERVKHAFLPGIEAQAMLAARFDERSGLAQNWRRASHPKANDTMRTVFWRTSQRRGPVRQN